MLFDFDTWARLAKDDPAEFERQRESALRALINAAPAEYRQRLEGLQFRLDLERQRSSTPLASCIRMNSLMWAGFHRLRKELLRVQPHEPPPATDSVVRTSAEIIPIRTRHQPASTVTRPPA